MSQLLTQAEKIALIQRWQAIKVQLPPQVTLLAVSKTYPTDRITTLFEQGQTAFGENYVQEAVSKIHELSALKNAPTPIEWHYIGHIQRNKTKDLAENFDWVQGVDRLIIAQRLNDQRPDNLGKLNVCIQVNIDDESSKSGCQPSELPELIQQISQLSKLCLRGLMIIPAKNSDTAFSHTQRLFEQSRQYHAQPSDWDTLSMGMSADMTQAIQNGSTMVRVGTAIFGAREYNK